MKKATNLISFLILMMVLVGCSKETVHIDFPFEVGDVENVERPLCGSTGISRKENSRCKN